MNGLALLAQVVRGTVHNWRVRVRGAETVESAVIRPPYKYIEGKVILNLNEVFRRAAYIHLMRQFTVIALRKRTTGSEYRLWRWACRAVPGEFSRALQLEMLRMINDLHSWRTL